MEPANREVEIGRRLRAWREAKLIPRTKMAVVLEIGNERLASYEGGRAALPYSVFRDLKEHFGLDAVWLATGETWADGLIYSEKEFEKYLTLRPKFSRIFDEFILEQLRNGGAYNLTSIDELPEEIRAIKTSLKYQRATPEVKEVVDNSLRSMAARQAVAAGEREAIQKILDSDSLDTSANVEQAAGLNSKLTALIARVKIAANHPGKKSDLARFLRVPLKRVSEWISGDRNPSGETTLQMLEWVAAEEAQQNKSSGSAQTPPEPKTRRKPHRETRKPSGRRKK